LDEEVSTLLIFIEQRGCTDKMGSAALTSSVMPPDCIISSRQIAEGIKALEAKSHSSLVILFCHKTIDRFLPLSGFKDLERNICFLSKLPLPRNMPLMITFHRTLFHLRLKYHLVAYYHLYLHTVNEFEWGGLDEDLAHYIFRVLLPQIAYDFAGRGGNEDELFRFQADDSLTPAIIFNISLDTFHPCVLNVV
jgi:hypothetical protein